VFPQLLSASFRQTGYNHIESRSTYVGEEQLKELQRKALSAVESKRAREAEREVEQECVAGEQASHFKSIRGHARLIHIVSSGTGTL
jgi:hypothetical protein